MELRHLRYFVAAAEAGHFGRAAERLHISGPGLGQQIKELEEELGYELFERLPRGVKLTDAGAALLTNVRRILADLRTAADQGRDVARGCVGILRVAHVPRGAGLHHLIPAFCLRYPQIEVRSVDLNTAEQYAALEESRIDVGLVYAPPESTPAAQSELLNETLLDGALLPSSHPLAKKTTLRCRDLQALSMLTPPASINPLGHAFVMKEFRARGLEPHCDGDHQITDPSVRVSFIAAGAGWMPASAASLDTLVGSVTGVTFCKWAEAPIRYPCSIIWRPNDRSPVVANFVAFCRELRDRSELLLPGRIGAA